MNSFYKYMCEIIYLGIVFVQEIGNQLCGQELSMQLKGVLICVSVFYFLLILYILFLFSVFYRIQSY